MSDADRPTIDQPHELIVTSRRYVLGEVPDGYGIWDSLAGNELVERFPLTEDGLDIAMERFDELKRRDRRDRWNPYRMALIATVAGASLWLLAGTLATVVFTREVGAGIEELLSLLDVLGYRLAVGSPLVLAVLLCCGVSPARRTACLRPRVSSRSHPAEAGTASSGPS
jgi:hypothetical protein